MLLWYWSRCPTHRRQQTFHNSFPKTGETPGAIKQRLARTAQTQCKICSKDTAAQANFTKLRKSLSDPKWFEVHTTVCSDLKALRAKPSMYGFCRTYLKIYDLCNEDKAEKDLFGHQVQSHIISGVSSHTAFPYCINLYLWMSEQRCNSPVPFWWREKGTKVNKIGFFKAWS